MLGLLDFLFLQPLMQIYSGLYVPLKAMLGPGPGLMAFSIVLNLLLLPLYYGMEESSRHARAVKGRVEKDVARMKQHFSGRERYFYIRAVYRQHRYHPMAQVLGSADLFVQIIVFATVFHFVSGPAGLAGVSFGHISDLSRPDELLGGVNVLPFLMTAANALVVFNYSDDPRRRMQAWGLAALFLVLLYRSPSALVLYWTANNLFSLARIHIFRNIGRLPESLRRSTAELALQR